MASVTVVPAYGRDYKSAEEVREAWLDGYDFQINDISSEWNGSYLSVRDGFSVTVRYHGLERVTNIGADNG